MHRVIDAAALAEGARNLLCNCAGFGPGDEVVICREDARHGWYDASLAPAVATEARRLGLAVRLVDVPAPDDMGCHGLPDELTEARNVVFFARIGDHDRFGAAGGGRRVMVYARTPADLASEFGRTLHEAMSRLKQAVDGVLFAADVIEITCPRGTAVRGAVGRAPGPVPDVTVRRFPLGVPAPVPAAGFSGRVALARNLTPTGNRAYRPPVLPLSAPVTAEIEGGRIAGFHGAPDAVAAIEAHYRHVAGLFGIDPFTVHSWHAGLHPGCRFVDDDGRDSDLWSNSVFSSPRLLHFHTCGTEAPGEISWNIVDATVRVDGKALWLDGRLRPAAFPSLAACIARHDALAALFPGPGTI